MLQQVVNVGCNLYVDCDQLKLQKVYLDQTTGTQGLWIPKHLCRGSGWSKLHLLSNNQPEFSAAETRVYGPDKVYSTHLGPASLVNESIAIS